MAWSRYGEWHSCPEGSPWRVRDRIARLWGYHCWDCLGIGRAGERRGGRVSRIEREIKALRRVEEAARQVVQRKDASEWTWKGRLAYRLAALERLRNERAGDLP